MTSLVSFGAPVWLRGPILDYISTIPLRPHGVRSVIDFIALATSSPALTPADNGFQQSPTITSHTVLQISKLLTVVPKRMSERAYYSALAVQLHDLLDGSEGADLAKVAAAIIGSGILGRKSVGAPGAVGWDVFVEPLLTVINPSLSPFKADRSTQAMKVSEDTTVRVPLITQDVLHVSLQRLSLIVHSTPNVGLTKRLLKNLFLPLWGLYNHAIHASSTSLWAALSWDLLRVYTIRCSNPAQLCDLAGNLLWNGPQPWEFVTGDSGGVDIYSRSSRAQDGMENLIELMVSVEARVKSFVKLLSVGSVDIETLGHIFLQTTKRWLSPCSAPTQSTSLMEKEEMFDPLQSLFDATLIRAMLERFESELSKTRANIVLLIEQVLKSYNSDLKDQARISKGMKRPTFRGLENMLQQDMLGASTDNQASSKTLRRESEELASMGLSLLSTVLAGPDPLLGKQMFKALAAVRLELESLPAHGTHVPDELLTSSKALQSLITTTIDGVDSASGNFTSPMAAVSKKGTKLERDRQSYQEALSNLTNDHPAIRAEALYMLRMLISPQASEEESSGRSQLAANEEVSTVSQIIDTTSTTYLLVSILQDPEEYVYLAAISTLVALATHQPQKVLALLIQCYTDNAEERSLDERLRIGEALSKTLSELDDPRAGEKAVHLVHDLRHSIAGGLISVASRRTKRAREAARKRQMELRSDKEARMMWGGEIPDVSDLWHDDGDDTNDTDTREAHARVLRGWEGKDAEEDVRVRASALSLLAKTITSEATASDVVSSLDLATEIIAYETGDEKALLRRASALLLLELVMGHDSRAHIPPRRMREVIDLLERVKRDDSDELVRGHVEILLERIAELQVVRFTDEHREVTRSQFSLAQGMLAGLVINPEAPNQSRSHRLIEEVDNEKSV